MPFDCLNFNDFSVVSHNFVTNGWNWKLNIYDYGVVVYVKFHQSVMKHDACSNMVANILYADTPSTLGVGSKGQFFSESSHFAYQIKGNGA